MPYLKIKIWVIFFKKEKDNCVDSQKVYTLSLENTPKYSYFYENL
jgi:hypothetical protein